MARSSAAASISRFHPSIPTAHAEIVALRDAARAVGNYRLTGATMCVTIEPCLMCVGALVHARIGRLAFGAAEPKAGAIFSAMRALDHPTLNHRFEAIGGVLEDDCRDLVQMFFRDRRHARVCRAAATSQPEAGPGTAFRRPLRILASP